MRALLGFKALLEETGIRPHTINVSAGFYGKTDRLPPKEALSVITMCGHGLISKNLVTDRVKKIRQGTLTVEDAVKDISLPCTCGIFNPERAANLLKTMVAQADQEHQ